MLPADVPFPRPALARPPSRAIVALVLREIATAQGRIAGGYLWSVAEPVAAVALLSAVFALAFTAPPLGQDFALFYATGYLPFMLYMDLAQKTGVALRFSRPLLAYPAVSWIDAIIARFVLNLLTQLLVITIMLGGLAVLSSDRLVLRPDLLAQGLGLAAVWGLGIGTLNAFLFGWWPVWERLWTIVTRPLFIISGIVFLPEAVPAPWNTWLQINPLTHAIGLTRAGLYPGYDPVWTAPLVVGAVALVPLTLGLALLCRHASQLLHEM